MSWSLCSKPDWLASSKLKYKEQTIEIPHYWKNTPSACDQQLSHCVFAPTAFSVVNIRASPYFYTQQIIQGSNSDVRINWGINREYIQFIGSRWERKIEVENVEHAKRERKALHHFSFSRMFVSTCLGFFFKFLKKMSFESFK